MLTDFYSAVSVFVNDFYWESRIAPAIEVSPRFEPVELAGKVPGFNSRANN